MIPETLEALRVPVDGLQPYKRNPRQGDVGAIIQSLERHGQYRPIVVNARTQEVLAGNHTLAAARQLGWDEIAATFVDVDEDTAARIVLVDNRTNDLASYDDGGLADLLRSLPDLEGTGYSGDDLDELLQTLDPVEPGRDTEPGEPPAEPRTKPGDLWVLDDHRLLCGDATIVTDIDRVTEGATFGAIVTDPPYGISANGMTLGTGKKDFRRGGDWDHQRPDITHLLALAPQVVIWGGNYYADVLPVTNDWLCWHKKNDGLTFSEFELAWTNLGHNARILDHHWSGEEKKHPTQKPLPVIEWCLGLTAGDVLDPFAGSGTSLIACENLSRRCYAMEIDPGYCDVIVDRWERHTGKEATLDASRVEAHA